MALPQASQNVIDNVAEAEAEDARNAALAETKTQAPETGVAAQGQTELVKGSPEAIGTAVKAIAEAQGAASVDPMKFLEELGILGVHTDFTSFPTITLNNEVFSTAENKNFGKEFECVYMHKMDYFLYKGDLGRDKELELVYSDDGLTCNATGEPIAKFIEDWKTRGITAERKEYTRVIVHMVDTEHAGEICQIQVSPASRGKLAGYLVGLAMKKVNPKEVVTKVGIGATMGSGIKAFTPYTFKHVKGG